MRKSALSALMFMIALAALAPVGAQAAAGWSAPVKIDGAGQLESVSCVSGGFCAATDFDGNALTEQGGD